MCSGARPEQRPFVKGEVVRPIKLECRVSRLGNEFQVAEHLAETAFL
jgi:hypothetical protein